MDDWRVLLAVLFLAGALMAGLNMARQQGERALLHREQVLATRASVEIARAQPAFPSLTHYSPHMQLTQAPERAALPGPIATAPVILDLPGVTTLGQVAGYRPTRDRILLGLGPGGALITVSIEDLLHLLIVGRTGGGKSVIERLIMTCLGAIPDVELYWWNPHYTPRDPATGDEWDLIAARCADGRALVGDGEILAALERLATGELPARKARYHAGQHPGPPRFYVIDEAPILAAADKRFMPWLGAVLREGRKFGLYIIMATQDALVSTLGGSSGLRAQAQTVYYVGGDSYSAKALLGFVPPDPEGRGICHLKSTATPGAPLIRVPRPTNADVQAWLGPLVNTASHPFVTASSPLRVSDVPSQAAQVDAQVGELVDELAIEYKGRPLPVEFIAQVRALFEQDLGPSDITKALSPSGSTGGDLAVKVGLVYQALVKQLRAQVHKEGNTR
jgi:hypothetical protein